MAACRQGILPRATEVVVVVVVVVLSVVLVAVVVVGLWQIVKVVVPRTPVDVR